MKKSADRKEVGKMINKSEKNMGKKDMKQDKKMMGGKGMKGGKGKCK